MNKILLDLEAARCSRCGQQNEFSFMIKLALKWKIFQMRREGIDDTHIIVYLNRLMSAVCNK